LLSRNSVCNSNAGKHAGQQPALSTTRLAVFDQHSCVSLHVGQYKLYRVVVHAVYAVQAAHNTHKTS
jgi:hypothetical protein